MLNRTLYFFLCFTFLATVCSGQENEENPLILSQKVGQQLEITPAERLNGRISRFAPSWFYEGIAYVGQNSASRNSKYKIWYSPSVGQGSEVPFLIEPHPDLDMNYGPVTWDQEKKEIYYTRSKMSDGDFVRDARGRIILEIYKAKTLSYDNWVDAESVFGEHYTYSNCHPAFWDAKDRLIFASDRAGGEGRMDLYEIVRIDGKWSEPIHLGGGINSPGHDIHPFIHESGHLIFASNREGSEGLDLYIARYEDNHWNLLGKLPAPFNGPDDDFGLILDKEAKQGVMSTNYNTTKGQDWLMTVSSENSLLPLPETPVFQPRIMVVDASTGQPIDQAEAGFFEYDPGLFADTSGLFKAGFESGLEKGEKMVVRYTLDREKASPYLQVTGTSGEAAFKTPRSEQYLIYASHPQYQTSQLIIPDDSLESGKALVVELEPDLRRSLSIQFISTTGELLRDLDVFLTEMPSGKSNFYPVLEDRFLRVQVYEHKDYKMAVIKEGYKAKNFIFNLAKEEMGDDLIVYLESEELPVESLEEEEPLIVLEQILYDYDDSKIKNNYAFELDLLADMLEKFPDIKVELASHTDSRGGDEYNQKLSEKRALAAKDYLVDKGVDPDRIIAVGYGETKLRNRCKDGVDCTEEEHQYNRRTEVRVVSEGND